MNVRALISSRIEAALAKASGNAAAAVVQPSSRPEFGDYQSNGVMGAAKRIGVNPRQLAADVPRFAHAQYHHPAATGQQQPTGVQEWLATQVTDAQRCLLGAHRISRGSRH